MEEFSSAIATFSAKFINELETSKSVVSSPLSVEFVLGLLTLGCTDPAHQELLAALGLPDDDVVKSSFSSLSSKVKDVKGVTLNVANKIYINEGPHDLKAELKNDAIKVFDADLEKINFSNSITAASTINKWVESKTNNRIKDLLSSDSLDSMTRLVLVNALYFKGSWQKKFDSKLTRDLPFFVSEGNSKPVPMMYQEDNFNYGQSKTLGVQYLAMGYEGKGSSMLIILPDEVEGLSEVLKKLAGGYDLMADLKKLMRIKVQVTIPKFKIETTIDLNELLPKLGVSAIFNQQNSGITKLMANGEELYVSKAIQKAFIEVNEEGAEAAAATAMAMAFCSAMIMPQTPEFVADRPFLVAILVGLTPYFFASYYGDSKN